MDALDPYRLLGALRCMRAWIVACHMTPPSSIPEHGCFLFQRQENIVILLGHSNENTSKISWKMNYKICLFCCKNVKSMHIKCLQDFFEKCALSETVHEIFKKLHSKHIVMIFWGTFITKRNHRCYDLPHLHIFWPTHRSYLKSRRGNYN